METAFYKPIDLQTATALMARYTDHAVLVNGGTDIVIEIAQKRCVPEAVVHLEAVAELQGITENNGDIVIGGAVTYLAMQRSPICRRITGLMQALSNLGSPAIRAVATPAGNIGTAAPSADCTTMLLALEARVVLASTTGERVVPLKDFFLQRNTTVMNPTEIIKAIRFSAPGNGVGTGYVRVARRKAQDIGKILVGVSLHVDKGVCIRAAVGLGALNATPVRAWSIEESLVGQRREEALAFVEKHFPFEAGLRESYFKHYKQVVATTIIARALDMAWASAVVPTPIEKHELNQSCINK